MTLSCAVYGVRLAAVEQHTYVVDNSGNVNWVSADQQPFATSQGLAPAQAANNAQVQLSGPHSVLTNNPFNITSNVALDDINSDGLLSLNNGESNVQPQYPLKVALLASKTTIQFLDTHLLEPTF